ncbi:MAG: hypothetical protein AUI83_13830 [Armatimonadetes bacterium 13_1_40CM_3_65_7]|nr:MAG: hypothetical protein AUI83_13830 [Armatimonadetes bacterium 13_1_40CM_3_65_7]
MRFRDDLIDHRFHILRTFPHHKLPIRAGAFAHDPLDMRHFRLSAQLFHFRANELEHLMKQFPLLHFTFAAEVDQFPVQAIAQRTPSVFID